RRTRARGRNSALSQPAVGPAVRAGARGEREWEPGRAVGAGEEYGEQEGIGAVGAVCPIRRVRRVGRCCWAPAQGRGSEVEGLTGGKGLGARMGLDAERGGP